MKYDQKLEVTEALTAPIKEGEKVGRLVLLQDGKEMGAVDVLAARGVKPEEQGFLAKLAAWFRSLWKGFF